MHYGAILKYISLFTYYITLMISAGSENCRISLYGNIKVLVNQNNNKYKILNIK